MALAGEKVSKMERTPYCADQVLLRGAEASESSSTALLGAGAQFVGKPIDLLDWASIVVTAVSDVASAAGGLLVEFSRAGTAGTWHEFDTNTIAAGTLQTYTYQPSLRYMRVSYTNGAVEQATFCLSVQVRTVAVAASEIQVTDGTDKLLINADGSISARTVSPVGRTADVSFMRTMATHTPLRMVGTGFVGATNDAKFWTTAVSGTGATSVQSDGHVSLVSGTGNSGYANLTSVQAARFVFAHPMIFRGAFSISAQVVALCSRLWGVYTSTGTPPVPVDGFWFEQDPAGIFYIAYAKSGSITKVASGSFNGDVSTYTLDTKVHAFEVHYFVMKAEYYVDNVLIHTLDSTTTTDHFVDEYSLPIQATCKNSALGVTSGSLVAHAAVIMREGAVGTDSVYYHLSGVAATHTLKLGPGRLHKILFNNTSGTNITIYDGLTAGGAVIGIITTTSAALGEWNYDLPFYTGLVMVTTGNALDATVVYE